MMRSYTVLMGVLTSILFLAAAPAGAWVLDGVARRHAGLFPAHGGGCGNASAAVINGERWYFTATLLDAHTVEVDAWVAALPATDAMWVRCGRWSGHLAPRPISVTDSRATYRIDWQWGPRPWPRQVRG